MPRRPNTRPARGPAVGLTPEPGLYRTRLVKGGPWVPARIWLSTARDPETGEKLDRAPQLLAMVAGEYVDPHEVWPLHPVDQATFVALIAAMPDDPRKPRELHAAKPLF